MVGQRPHHHELAFALEAPANVLKHVNVACARHLWTQIEEGCAINYVRAIWGTLQNDRKRTRNIGRLEDDGMKLDSVTHGNHDLGAPVVVKEMMNGCAGAPVHGAARSVGEHHAGALSRRIERKAQGFLCVRIAKGETRNRIQFHGHLALALIHQLSILDRKAERRVRL